MGVAGVGVTTRASFDVSGEFTSVGRSHSTATNVAYEAVAWANSGLVGTDASLDTVTSKALVLRAGCHDWELVV